MASEKLTDLTPLSDPIADDLLYIVDDPLVTPVSKKITLASLLASPLLLDNLGTNWNRYVLGAGLFRTIRTLDNDQVKALPTVTLDTVPAPGAGAIIMPISVVTLVKFAAGAYGNIGALTNLTFGWGANPPGSGLYGSIFDSNVALFSAFDQFMPLQLGDTNDGQGFTFCPGNETSLFEDQSFNVRVLNEAVAGDLTLGNATNTMTLITDYSFITIP
jgi:hypothetical protein